MWTLLSIASSLLVVQMQLVRWFHRKFVYSIFLIHFRLSLSVFPNVKKEHIFGFELINTLIILFYAFAYTFLFCTFGEMVTHQFNVFSEELYMCDWYMFPLELQRMLIIFIANAQQPATVHGFGDTTCTRDTFKRVNGFTIGVPSKKLTHLLIFKQSRFFLLFIFL